MKELHCCDCPWCWKAQEDNWRCCHFEHLFPEDKAPCELTEDDFVSDEIDETADEW